VEAAALFLEQLRAAHENTPSILSGAPPGCGGAQSKDAVMPGSAPVSFDYVRHPSTPATNDVASAQEAPDSAQDASAGIFRAEGNLSGPDVTLGYAGLVSSRLDLPLLAELAERRPEWSLVLVGEIAPTGCEAELARLAGLPNVTLAGLRPAAEMPGIIARWDVGLIPYRVNEETRHASPLKLYEYLAAGLPVVSADVPAVRPFAGLIEIAGGTEETVAAVARALAADSPAARAGRRAAVREHSWDARVESLSEMLAEALAR
jgi:glycosyltransferase involved in cell wall biosynthesis